MAINVSVLRLYNLKSSENTNEFDSKIIRRMDALYKGIPICQRQNVPLGEAKATARTLSTFIKYQNTPIDLDVITLFAVFCFLPAHFPKELHYF